MIRAGLTGLLLWLFSTAALAGGSVETSPSSSVKTSLRVESPLLGRDLRYSIYLPERSPYAPPPPVLYLLHGLGGNERDWLRIGSIKQTVDKMISKGEIPPLAIVMPGAGNSWYVDSATHGPVESALLDILIPHVENTHGLREDRNGRFVAGLSMGGYGALRLAILHPSRFRGGASLSGAIFADLASASQVTKGQIRMFKGAFGKPFAPEMYNRLNFFSRLGDLKAAKQRPALFISVGDDDGFRLYEGAVELYLRLKRLRLPVEMRIVDGDHNWRLWREDIIPVLRYFGSILRADAEASKSSGTRN
jgi:enterochelin esterase-like enzyme